MAFTSSWENSICGISLCRETIPSKSSCCNSRGANRALTSLIGGAFLSQLLASSLGDCREAQHEQTGNETPRWVGEAHVHGANKQSYADSGKQQSGNK